MATINRPTIPNVKPPPTKNREKYQNSRQDAVSLVVIESQPTSHLDNGDRFYLLARSFDTESRELFGASFEWRIDGKPRDGQGDLLAATYSDSQTARVTVSAGSESDSINVSMSRVFDTSSNDIGCNQAHSSGNLPLILMLASLALVFHGRRKAPRTTSSDI